MTWPENMTAEEKRVVDELRRRTINDLSPKVLEDESVFYRFCKARDFNLEDAEAMLRKSIVWRKENNIDTILTDYKPLEVLSKYMPTSFLCYDKEGCVVRYIDFGNADYKGIFHSAKKSDIMQYLSLMLEQDIQYLKERSIKIRKPVTQFFHVCNFENLTFAKATYKKAIETALHFLTVLQDNYPERIKVTCHINSSFSYTVIFNIAKTVLASPLLQKIQCFGTEGWKEYLLEHIDADDLPAFLGGKRTDPDCNPRCDTFIIHGHQVPRRYYLSNYEKMLSKAIDAEKLLIYPFSKVERSIDVQKGDFYLEWEFETKNRDIGFAMYFKEASPDGAKPVELVPNQKIDTCYEPEKGIFKCQKAGIYTLVFDNSYSWLHPKEVYYRAKVRNPEDSEIH